MYTHTYTTQSHATDPFSPPNRSIGYLLHPSIQSKLPANARIADVATGTGIWLSDLSAASPQSHTFTGFDISNDQFLAPSSLPSNVKLTYLDFKKPIPEDVRGKFDLVNIRLIIISMGPEKVWKETLTNLLTLLKPGGAITWTEGNFLVARGFRGSGANDSSSTPGHALTAGQNQLNSTLIRRFGYSFPDFKALFEDAGLKDVQTDVISTDRLVEMRREFTEIGVGAVFGGLKNLARVEEEGGWGEEEVESRRVEAVADLESGAYLRWDIHVAVGFTATE